MNNLHVRQRPLPVLRTMASGSGAARLPRHRPGADTHDQLPVDRPRGPRVAISGAARGLQSGTAAAAQGGIAAAAADGAATVLTPMTVTLLSSHRRVPPYGMAGGAPGALGHQWIERADGTIQPMAGRDSVAVAAGEVFVIETPGGGGYGPPS